MSVKEALTATTADGRPKAVSGAVGAAPPPDAPREVAAPITPDAQAEMQARAEANATVLKPFPPPSGPPLSPEAAAARLKAMGIAVPEPNGNPALTMTPASAASPAPPNRTIRRVTRPAVPASGIVLTDADVPSLAAPTADDLAATGQGDIDQIEDYAPQDPTGVAPLTDEDRARMPAASESEDPARGKLAVHPGQQPADKQVTGGFSDALDAQYFPLDGSELGQLILGLLDQIAAQVPNDLRLSVALTYPRVRARVRVEIEGHAEDADCGFVIEKVFVPKDGQPGSTPLEVARQRAHEVVFVVQALRQEFDEAGESDQPPDALRDELGLERPHKQLLTDASGHRVIVDRLPTDLAALTGGGR